MISEYRLIILDTSSRYFGFLSASGLMSLEGVGPIGSVLLYATRGTGETFVNGRQFSAYLGLTPKQFSSGGKVNLVGISKRVANKRLRAVLIQGGTSVCLSHEGT
jgi:transposase